MLASIGLCLLGHDGSVAGNTLLLAAKGLHAAVHVQGSNKAVKAFKHTTALHADLPSATCRDCPIQLVPAWCAEWYFRSSLDRYVWIHGMLCAFLHPWGERMLQKIDKLNLQTRLLVKTGIVAGEVGFVYSVQGWRSWNLPPVGQAGGSVIMSPSEGPSICLASCFVCH